MKGQKCFLFQLNEVYSCQKNQNGTCNFFLKQNISNFQGKQMTVNIESTLNSLEGSEIKSLFSLFSMTCNK